MKLEHVSESWLKNQLRRILTKYLDPQDYHFFFFGSRVRGKGGERSDIDIGVEGPEPVPLGTLSRIKEEISNLPLLYPVDVVDFASSERDFREVAKKHTEPI